MKNKLIEVLIFIIFLSLIINSNLVTSELIEALKTFAFILFPSIFPFFLISDLLIYYNFPHTLNKFFKTITKKIFHTSNASTFVIIMSMLSGFPSGAKYIRTLLDKKMLTINQANYLITFTHFANPLFVITVTQKIFNDINISYLILISMYLSNLIIGFIIRPKFEDNNNKMEYIETPSFSTCLSNSITNSINLLIIILGNTCFFFIVTKLITTYFNFNDVLTIFINGFFDITKGINSLTLIDGNIIFKGIVTLTFISFGGININMQVLNIISDTKIKYKNFLLGRICQIAISSAIFLILISNT